MKTGQDKKGPKSPLNSNGSHAKMVELFNME